MPNEAALEAPARVGDGLVSTAPQAELVDAFLAAGGSGPRYGQLTVCWAETEEEGWWFVKEAVNRPYRGTRHRKPRGLWTLPPAQT